MTLEPANAGPRTSRVASLAASAVLLLAAIVAVSPSATAETWCDTEVGNECLLTCNDNPGYEGCCASAPSGAAVCVRDYCQGVAVWTNVVEVCASLQGCSGSIYIDRECQEKPDTPDVPQIPPEVPEQIFGSCTGTDQGLVVLGMEVCETPPTVGLCPAGSYGVVVNGNPNCHTVGVCTSNPYGVNIDGSGCVTLSSCGGGRIGYKVNGNDVACVDPVNPPDVVPCSEGVGVVIDGDETACYTAGVCSGETGVHIDGHCYDVVVCSGDQVGAIVDGTVACVPSPVEQCPNGRKGVVVEAAGRHEEICPLS